MPRAYRKGLVEGEKFGRLEVVSWRSEVDSRGRDRTMVVCRCDCGKEVEVRRDSLRSGKTTSCDCLRVERAVAKNTTHGMSSGEKKTPEYAIWVQIKDRCSNPKNGHYDRYGGRGITICPEWRDSFTRFLSDVGARPSPELTIDRIDNNRGYEPGNVRWVTRRVQSGNRVNTVRLTYNGRTECLAEWARIIGVTPATLAYRIRSGWSEERTLSPRSSTGRRYKK